MFFSFDGIDGAGKSTQLQLFARWLEQRGHQVVTCRDPGTTELGEEIRSILLGAEYRIDNRSEMLLYMACRAQMVQEIVRPALQDGKVVVSDRFVLANVVYQGCAGDIAPEEIWKVGSVATQNLLPDLTFVLDLPLDAAMQRLGTDQDRMEARGSEYFTRVRAGFLEQATKNTSSSVVVDAARSVDAIQTEIRSLAASKLARP